MPKFIALLDAEGLEQPRLNHFIADDMPAALEHVKGKLARAAQREDIDDDSTAGYWDFGESGLDDGTCRVFQIAGEAEINTTSLANEIDEMTAAREAATRESAEKAELARLRAKYGGAVK